MANEKPPATEFFRQLADDCSAGAVQVIVVIVAFKDERQNMVLSLDSDQVVKLTPELTELAAYAAERSG